MSTENKALPPLPDSLRDALPPLAPLGGPPLESKHEYSNAPYKHAVTKRSRMSTLW
jgi:hypothetical protein